jgi:hypothetical protein
VISDEGARAVLASLTKYAQSSFSDEALLAECGMSPIEIMLAIPAGATNES